MVVPVDLVRSGSAEVPEAVLRPPPPTCRARRFQSVESRGSSPREKDMCQEKSAQLSRSQMDLIGPLDLPFYGVK